MTDLRRWSIGPVRGDNTVVGHAAERGSCERPAVRGGGVRFQRYAETRTSAILDTVGVIAGFGVARLVG